MGLDSIMNFFKFEDPEFDDDYDDSEYSDSYAERSEPPIQKKPQPRTRTPQEEYEPESKQQKSSFLNAKSKVVSMNRSAMEVNVIKPHSFEDSQEICNMLLSNRPVIVNLEGFDPDDAQRIMDFISGCIYAINGKYHQISKYIFIFSPENVDISGDSMTLEGVSSMPVINREF